MSVNNNPINSDLQFLRVLSKEVSPRELLLLSEEAGFLPPVSFSFDRIRAVLDKGRFPVEHEIEYSWALAECELSRLMDFSVPVRILVSSIFAHCNMRQPLGTRIESDFYWLGVEGALQGKSHRLRLAFCSFLERLETFESMSTESQKYFCSLSQCFLRAGAGLFSESSFDQRIALLKSWINGKEDSDVTDSLRGLDPWRSVQPNMVGGIGAHQKLMTVLPCQKPSVSD